MKILILVLSAFCYTSLYASTFNERVELANKVAKIEKYKHYEIL